MTKLKLLKHQNSSMTRFTLLMFLMFGMSSSVLAMEETHPLSYDELMADELRAIGSMVSGSHPLRSYDELMADELLKDWSLESPPLRRTRTNGNDHELWELVYIKTAGLYGRGPPITNTQQRRMDTLRRQQGSYEKQLLRRQLGRYDDPVHMEAEILVLRWQLNMLAWQMDSPTTREEADRRRQGEASIAEAYNSALQAEIASKARLVAEWSGEIAEMQNQQQREQQRQQQRQEMHRQFLARLKR